MKKALVIITVLSLAFTSYSQPATKGWSGTFMDQFDLEIIYYGDQDGLTEGSIMMLDGGMILQDDMLTDIEGGKEGLSFIIPAKQTSFIGSVSQDGRTLDGEFTFPDGSKHPVTLERMVSPMLNWSVADYHSELIPPGEIQQDLAFLYEKMVEFHPSLRDPAQKEGYEKMFGKLQGNLQTGMSTPDILRLAANLTNAVNCGHTGVRMPTAYQKAASKEEEIFFPLSLYFAENDIFIQTGQPGEENIQPGATLLSVNGTGSDELISSLAAFVPADGGKMSTKRKLVGDSFSELLALVDPSTSFMVKYKENNIGSAGIIRESDVPAVSYSKASQTHGRGMSQADPVSFILWEEEEAGYLKVPSFAIFNVNQYIMTMDSVFRLIDSLEYERLVIDLRDNAGGHPIFAAQLLSYLADEKFTYFAGPPVAREFMPLYSEMDPNPIHFSGTCYLIVNEGCQSTTGHLISLLDDRDLCYFIGKEPGSTYTCNDNSMKFRLPKTHIEANIATMTFTTTVSEEYKSSPFKVDYPVRVTWRQVANSEDPFIAETKKVFRKGEE